MSQSIIPMYTVFISHAGEDKTTIAIPLREKLKELGISAFVDELDITPGFDAEEFMISVMNTAKVAVVVLSPEFVSRKWPMKELMCFLRRFEESTEEPRRPTIIPFFYRLSISELYQEPRLDRTGIDGQNLYKASRFHERMQAGEPEASIPGIMGALRKLHRIMGVRNDLGASNDSSYQMSLRRKLLLKILCDAVARSTRRDPLLKALSFKPEQSGGETFRAHYESSFTIADLIFDFVDNGQNSLTRNTEGRLLQAIIDDSPEANRVLALCGMAGVGKTSLLRKLSSLEQIKRRFTDGLYHVSLGMDSTKANLIEDLSKAVRSSGGSSTGEKMHKGNDLQQVIKYFKSWFAERQFMLFIDDIWKNQEISEDTIYELVNLHACGRDSKVLFTTRNSLLASQASVAFTLDPRTAISQQSRSILLQYSGLAPVPHQIAENRVIDEILERCQGLPLFLAIAGRSVKALSLRPGYEGCTAYHAYAVYLRVRVDPLLHSGMESYQALAPRLRISLDLLEGRTRVGINVRFPFPVMHRRLSVILRQAWVPMTMLYRLWELENKAQAAAIALEYAHVGLADIDLRTSPSEPDMMLRLHDSVYEFALEESREHGEEISSHEMLLREYGRDVEAKLGKHLWWSSRLKQDGYIHWHLCRHLNSAGRCDELVTLLFRPEWVSRVIPIRPVADLEGDFILGISAIRKERVPRRAEAGSLGTPKNKDLAETLHGLRLILKSLRLSCLFAEGNPREILFQMHGRLLEHAYRLPPIRRYVSWIEKKSQKPRLLSLCSFLRSPSDDETNISDDDDSITCSIVLEECSSVRCMVVMNNGYQVVCGFEDGTIDILNLREDKKIEKAWKAHEDEVLAISVARNDKRFASGSLDTNAKVWDLESGDLISTFLRHTDRVTCIAMIGDGERVLSASYDGTTHLWDLATGNFLLQLVGYQGWVRSMTVLPDGYQLVTAGSDKSVRLWNTNTGTQIAEPVILSEYSGNSIAYMLNNQLVSIGSEDGDLRIWNLANHTQVGEEFIGHKQSINYVDTNKDGSRILSCSDDDTICLWDVQSRLQVCEPLLGHMSSVNAAFFLSSDEIVSCSDDGTVRLWNLPKDLLHPEERHEKAVTCIIFTPDGTKVVSGSEDATIRIWDKTGRPIGLLKGHRSDVTGLAILPGRNHLLSVSLDDTLRVWDIESCTCIHTLTCESDLVHAVVVLPSGGSAVTGSYDRTVRIWDLLSMDGRNVVLRGHNAPVRKVFLSKDGERIISVAGDEIFVWEISVRLAVMKVSKDEAYKLGKKDIFSAVHEEFDDVPIFIRTGREELSCSQICYGDGGPVLGTLDYEVRDWDYNEALCVGLDNGCVGILRVDL